MKDVDRELMRSRTCCFTGHREMIETEELIRYKIKLTLNELIAEGYRYFGVGGARGFDMLAAEEVLKMRDKHPEIRLILVIPCGNHTGGWPKEDLARQKALEEQADKVRVLAPHFYAGCMHVRNRHLVDSSSVCVSYLRKKSGGTFYTVNYARQNNIRVIEI